MKVFETKYLSRIDSTRIRREIFAQIEKEKGQVYFVYLGLSLLMSCAKRSVEKEKSLY